MIEAQAPAAQRGTILYDRSLGVTPDDAWFDRAHWADQGKAEAQDGGRGGVVFAETPVGPCALRHYHRGGLAARVSSDRYLWTGAARSRSFREFRLLAWMTERGLPVPAPVAARCIVDGLTYRADLLTRRIPQVRTLAQRMAADDLDAALAERVGQTLARFHGAQVWHADLNAHNILVDAAGAVWLIDFDRGRVQPLRPAWQASNLRRLRRSFDKLGAQHVAGFDEAFWRPMLAAYHEAMAGRSGVEPGAVR